MDDRIQRVLDGDLDRESLSFKELEELAEMETLIKNVERAVPGRILPNLGPAVLAQIENLSPQPATTLSAADRTGLNGTPSGAARQWRALRRWLWRPRPISLGLRPAYAFSAAAVLALFLFLARPGRDMNPIAIGSGNPPAGVPQVLVQFRFDAPRAQVVALAGDFTSWEPAYTLTRSEPGIWTVVVPLDPGVHDYAFIVDGERWVPDPMAPAVADGFGGLNSRIAVLTPDSGRPL